MITVRTINCVITLFWCRIWNGVALGGGVISAVCQSMKGLREPKNFIIPCTMHEDIHITADVCLNLTRTETHIKLFTETVSCFC